MRRAEYLVSDQAILDEFCSNQAWGTLGLVDEDGFPLGIPMSHGYAPGAFVFHGSAMGRKGRLGCPRPCSYSVVEVLSFIPTGWDSAGAEGVDPCSGTQFFRSVEARGTLRLCTDRDEKSRWLETLVNHQEACGGNPWRHSGPWPEGMLKATALWVLDTATMVGKWKLGQNMNPRDYQRLRTYLETRAKPIDSTTLALMDRFRV